MDEKQRRLFGERLKALREAKNLSQEQLGKMIGKTLLINNMELENEFNNDEIL